MLLPLTKAFNSELKTLFLNPSVEERGVRVYFRVRQRKPLFETFLLTSIRKSGKIPFLIHCWKTDKRTLIQSV